MGTQHGPAGGDVRETGRRDRLSVQEVPRVHHDGERHIVVHALEVEVLELAPIGSYDRAVRTLEASYGSGATSSPGTSCFAFEFASGS